MNSHIVFILRASCLWVSYKKETLQVLKTEEYPCKNSGKKDGTTQNNTDENSIIDVAFTVFLKEISSNDVMDLKIVCETSLLQKISLLFPLLSQYHKLVWSIQPFQSLLCQIPESETNTVQFHWPGIPEKSNWVRQEGLWKRGISDEPTIPSQEDWLSLLNRGQLSKDLDLEIENQMLRRELQEFKQNTQLVDSFTPYTWFGILLAAVPDIRSKVKPQEISMILGCEIPDLGSIIKKPTKNFERFSYDRYLELDIQQQEQIKNWIHTLHNQFQCSLSPSFAKIL